MKKVEGVFILVLACLLSACAQQHYVVQSITDTHVAMDSTWDAQINPEMAVLVASYKSRLDAEMSEPVGVAAQTLKKGFPQSLLSNFTADVMLQTGETLWGNVDFAVMNMGGMRSSLNSGTITTGNIYEVYPFENQLVLLELPGKAVKGLFEFIASNGGQGLSGTVCMVINKRNLQSLEINGNPLDENKTYRVVTIDYLADGNDYMTAFQKATRRIDSNETLRNAMIRYIKGLTAKNLEVNAKMDNRIIVNK